jgi:hypothetical protein
LVIGHLATWSWNAIRVINHNLFNVLKLIIYFIFFCSNVRDNLGRARRKGLGVL